MTIICNDDMNFGELRQLDGPKNTETYDLGKLNQNFNTVSGSPKNTRESQQPEAPQEELSAVELDLKLWNQQTDINLGNINQIAELRKEIATLKAQLSTIQNLNRQHVAQVISIYNRKEWGLDN